TLKNTGSANLTVASIVALGDFAQTNNCGISVAAGGNCIVSVTFTPSAMGARGGSLWINDDASDSPQLITLSGTAIAPAVTLSSTALTFANQVLGTTSPAQTVTLGNTGNEDLSVSSIVASGDFAQTNNCGSSMPADDNCTVSVTFTPTTTGARSGSITITDNAAGSPQQTVGLSGSGIPQLSMMLFPSTVTGGESVMGTVTLSPAAPMG